MTNPVPIALPNSKVLSKTFTAYLTHERARRLANIAEFLAMCHMPYNSVALLDFMLDAADCIIAERMSE